MALDLESLFEICSFSSYFFFSPNFGFFIGFLKFVDDMPFLWVADKCDHFGAMGGWDWSVGYEKGFQELEISTTTSYFIFMFYNFYFIFVFYLFNLFIFDILVFLHLTFV